jgi:hypothetical protein
MEAFETFISRIYDCAANPELWPEALSAIRDHLKAAYVMTGITDVSLLLQNGLPMNTYKISPWDTQRVSKIGQDMPSMPGFGKLHELELDDTWMQMDHCTEEDFRNPDFYRKWVAPQKLRDSFTTNLIKRQMAIGFATVASGEKRELFSKEDVAFMAALAPHLRRALTISNADRSR